MVDVDILDVLQREQLGVKVDVVSEHAIHHAQCLQRDVVLQDGILDGIGRQSQCLQLLLVGYALYLGAYRTAYIHHCRLWQLLDALHYHVSCKL